MVVLSPLAPIEGLKLLLSGSTGSKNPDLSALNAMDGRFVQSPSQFRFPFLKCLLWALLLIQ